MTDSDAAPDTQPEYADPSQFEDFDNVDSSTVELPDDSYDASGATDAECGC